MQVQGSAAMPTRRRSIVGLLATAGTLLTGCSGNSQYSVDDTGAAKHAGAARRDHRRRPGQSGADPASVGAGQCRRSPASRCATPPKWRSPNSTIPNIQLLVKDDGGTAQAAQLAAQQSLDDGAQIILGPLFSQSVGYVGAGRRGRAMCRSSPFRPMPMSRRMASIC